MKVLLVPSVSPAAQERAKLLCARLTIAGIDACVQPVDATDRPIANPAELALVVPMGGDGTFLYAARLIEFAPVPILGFNYGDLGFLSGNPEKDEAELIADALVGDLHLERRTTLDAVIVDCQGGEHRVTALNEIAYTRGASGHIVEYSFAINGTPIAKLKADGLVAATATGSTAYSLSAGGPILSPAYNGLVVVPLAPHTLNSRAIVMAPSDVLEVEMSGRSFEEASLFVDGVALDVHGPVSLRISKGENEVFYVRGGDEFFKSVAHVFFGGAR